MIRQFIWLEPALIFALILANGFFAAAEIAIIATRKSRIEALLEKGIKSAAAVARLKNDPDRFLATVQIGVTVVSSLASAIGGAAAIGYLKPKIESLPLPLIPQWGEAIAIIAIVLPISYFSLVLGELVPKSLALRFPERIACLVARPIDSLSRISAFLVRALTISSNAVLWLFGSRETEGASFIASGFSRIPVYEGELDRVIGILYNKDIFKALQEKSEFRIRDYLHPAFFVPSSLPISELLKQLQRRRLAIALVVNEFGEVEGLATLEDLLEEIVGEIRDEYDREERGPVERLADGSMVIQGSALLKDLKSDFNLPFEESPDYHTLAGFVLAKLQRIPRAGERVEHNGYRLTIVDMEGRRIIKIKLE